MDTLDKLNGKQSLRTGMGYKAQTGTIVHLW